MLDGPRYPLTKALSNGSCKLLPTHLQTMLAYHDGCTKADTVFDPDSGSALIQLRPLSEDRLYPKEKLLVDLVVA